jgi:hypothetical protein
MAHVDRSAVFGQRPLDNIDRPNNASAKPARLSKYDLHPLAFSSSLDGLAKTVDAELIRPLRAS